MIRVAVIAALALIATPARGQTVSPLNPPSIDTSSLSTKSDLQAVSSKADTAQANAASAQAQAIAAQATANAIPIALLPGGPYTVQDGGANPLSAAVTTMAKPGTLIAISDLGGCGLGGGPGFGYAIWTGTEARRISRGVQASVAPAAAIVLDYWKSPTRVIITGTTSTATRITIANAKDGALYSIAKPGLLTALVSAFGIGMAGSPTSSDIAIVGPSSNIFEIVNGALSQVQTY